MNENLNLVEILKDCPKGTKLYSPVFGDVELLSVHQNDCGDYPIEIKLITNSIDDLTIDGRLFADYDGECMLFPSREQRDWSKFKTKKPKFDPKTFQPFDKVLGRCNDKQLWLCDLYSYSSRIDDPYRHRCVRSGYKYCIPFNDDTKHLVATKEEAPEFYRYWEDLLGGLIMTREEERIKQIEKFASQCYEDGERYSAFISGAIFADNNNAQDVVNLNDLWHDVSEEPKDRSNILVRYNYLGCAELRSHRINYNHLPSWSEFIDSNEIEEWAYVSDILQKGGKR